jgi:DNA-binding MarR family transcriptional regulator
VAKRSAEETPSQRSELHRLLVRDTQAMTAHSDQIGRYFARLHGVSNSDLHALLHIMMAESAGEPLTLTQLRQRMDVSQPAVTYLVDRMIEAGHIRREADPDDRRKSMLRFEGHGMAVGREFFGPLGAHLQSALTDVPDTDLVVAHRVFTAMIAAMVLFEEELRGQSPALKKGAPRSGATSGRRNGIAP